MCFINKLDLTCWELECSSSLMISSLRKLHHLYGKTVWHLLQFPSVWWFLGLALFFWWFENHNRWASCSMSCFYNFRSASVIPALQDFVLTLCLYFCDFCICVVVLPKQRSDISGLFLTSLLTRWPWRIFCVLTSEHLRFQLYSHMFCFFTFSYLGFQLMISSFSFPIFLCFLCASLLLFHPLVVVVCKTKIFSWKKVIFYSMSFSLSLLSRCLSVSLSLCLYLPPLHPLAVCKLLGKTLLLYTWWRGQTPLWSLEFYN